MRVCDGRGPGDRTGADQRRADRGGRDAHDLRLREFRVRAGVRVRRRRCDRFRCVRTLAEHGRDGDDVQEPAHDQLDPDQHGEHAGERPGRRAVRRVRDRERPDDLEHLEADRAEQRTANPHSFRDIGGRQPDDEPEEHDRVADDRDEDAGQADHRAHARDAVQVEQLQHAESVAAVHAAVSATETSRPEAEPGEDQQVADPLLRKLRCAGGRFQMASIARRRLPIQPRPVSSTPTRPMMPTLVRESIALLIESRSVLPTAPGTFVVILSNSVCSVSGWPAARSRGSTRRAAPAGTAPGS